MICTQVNLLARRMENMKLVPDIDAFEMLSAKSLAFSFPSYPSTINSFTFPSPVFLASSGGILYHAATDGN